MPGLLQTLVTSWEKPLDRLRSGHASRGSQRTSSDSGSWKWQARPSPREVARPDSRATVFQTLLVVELCQAFDELASDWL